MNTKDFLKIAGVKNEQEFYKKFPTEEAFFEAYPQADMYKKGGKLKKKKQDPAHGYREFPPNVMAMGGGIIDMMETGGKLPESVLRPRLEAHMSTQEADSYLSKYKSGGYLPTMMQAGGSITNAQQTAGAAPSNEAQYNDDWTQAKHATRRMTAGEEFGYGLLDVVTAPVSAFTGASMSSLLTDKVGSTGKKGSAFGDINSSFIAPMVTSVLAESGIPIASQIGSAAQSINKTLSPMLNADNPQAVATQQGMSGLGSALGGIGKSLGNSMNKKQYGGPLKMEIGGPMPSSMGLNELTGPTHEEGGMAISPDVEVEGGETILEPASYVYSDSILVPGTKKTFAQASKAVKNKYKMREDDKLSQEAMNSELEALMNQQEDVKQSMMAADTQKFQNKMMAKYGGLMPEMQYPTDMDIEPMEEMKKGGSIYIKPSKRGTFTAAAKKRGMGVQEFASKVMANKKDYSPAMVKKANFAKNAAKWKKQFGGFIEDEGMQGPVMMYDGGYMANLSKIIRDSQNQPITGLELEGTAPVRTKDYATDMEIAAGLKEGPREFWPEYTPKSEEDTNKKKFDFDKLRMATTALAGIGAAAKGLLGKNKFQNIPQAKMNYINTRPAELLAERQGELALAAGLQGLRNNATTQGNYLANVSNLAATSGIGTGANVANIRFQGDTSNVGIANQAALQRQATTAQNIDRLEKFRTAELLRRDKMADDFSRIAQTANLDQQKKQQQQYLLEAIARGVAKVDNKGRIMYKSTDDQGNSEWVYASELG